MKQEHATKVINNYAKTGIAPALAEMGTCPDCGASIEHERVALFVGPAAFPGVDDG